MLIKDCSIVSLIALTETNGILFSQVVDYKQSYRVRQDFMLHDDSIFETNNLKIYFQLLIFFREPKIPIFVRTALQNIEKCIDVGIIADKPIIIPK